MNAKVRIPGTEDAWDNRELGADEKFVKVAELSEAEEAAIDAALELRPIRQGRQGKAVMTKLSEVIEQLGGDKRVAELLGTVRPRAVKSWRLGDRTPRPAEAMRLVELSGGTVRLEDLYSQT